MAKRVRKINWALKFEWRASQVDYFILGGLGGTRAGGRVDGAEGPSEGGTGRTGRIGRTSLFRTLNRTESCLKSRLSAWEGSKEVKRHAARALVGEEGKEGGRQAGRGVRESGLKSRLSVWEGSEKVTKTCSENAGRGGREGGLGLVRLGSARWGSLPVLPRLGSAWARLGHRCPPRRN